MTRHPQLALLLVVSCSPTEQSTSDGSGDGGAATASTSATAQATAGPSTTRGSSSTTEPAATTGSSGWMTSTAATSTTTSAASSGAATTAGESTSTTTTGDSGTSTGLADDCVEVGDGYRFELFGPDTIAWFEGLRCVVGHVFLDGPIPDLQAMSTLEELHGRLWIGSPEHPDDGPLSLAGLESLTLVEGLAVFSSSLETLEGLEGLTAIGEHGLMLEASGLTHVDALAGVHAIDGGVRIGGISDMSGLVSLAGLAGVTSLGTSNAAGLSIRRTGLTKLEDLAALESVDGILDIGVNAQLSSVDALMGLEDVTGVMIYANPQLPTCSALALTWSLPGLPMHRVMGNLADNCVIPGACAPFDAIPEGPCEAHIAGVFWNGASCLAWQDGCSCEGSECAFAKLWNPSLLFGYPDVEACEQAFLGC